MDMISFAHDNGLGARRDQTVAARATKEMGSVHDTACDGA